MVLASSVIGYFTPRDFHEKILSHFSHIRPKFAKHLFSQISLWWSLFPPSNQKDRRKYLCNQIIMLLFFNNNPLKLFYYKGIYRRFESSLKSRGTFETSLKFDEEPNSRKFIPAKFQVLAHSRNSIKKISRFSNLRKFLLLKSVCPLDK